MAASAGLNENIIVKTTRLAMLVTGQYIKYGDTVVDCTMGNGYDTLELARMVGIGIPCGKPPATHRHRIGTVYAFDVQDAALQSTAAYLEENGIDLKGKKIILEKLSHNYLSEYFKDKKEIISAFVFNLGFLPGQDKSILTTVETTIPAIVQALNLVRVNGVVSVTVYPGHDEGKEERDHLLQFLSSLPPKKYHVAYTSMINQKESAPSIFFITPKVKYKLELP